MALSITADDLVLAAVSGLIALAMDIPITYFIVDRVVQRRERKELAPVEQTGIQRLRTKLGVHFLTNYLIELVVEVETALKEHRTVPKETAQGFAARLKDSQNDIEIILDIYNQVLSTRVKGLTGAVILQIEHLQEDFEYLAEIYPKPITPVLANHIQDTILKTARVVKEDLRELRTDNLHVEALEEWLTKFTSQTTQPKRIIDGEEQTPVRGGHRV